MHGWESKLKDGHRGWRRLLLNPQPPNTHTKLYAGAGACMKRLVYRLVQCECYCCMLLVLDDHGAFKLLHTVCPCQEFRPGQANCCQARWVAEQPAGKHHHHQQPLLVLLGIANCQCYSYAAKAQCRSGVNRS